MEKITLEIEYDPAVVPISYKITVREGNAKPVSFSGSVGIASILDVLERILPHELTWFEPAENVF